MTNQELINLGAKVAIQEARERIYIDADVTIIDHQVEANRILAPYKEGYCDAIDILAKIRHLKEVLELAETQIKDDVTDYVARNGKTIQRHGLEVSYRNGSNKADFSEVSYVTDLQNKLKAVKEISKQLSKSGQSEMADTATGEIITACKFVPEKDTVTVKFI